MSYSTARASRTVTLSDIAAAGTLAGVAWMALRSPDSTSPLMWLATFVAGWILGSHVPEWRHNLALWRQQQLARRARKMNRMALRGI